MRSLSYGEGMLKTDNSMSASTVRKRNERGNLS